MMESKKLKNREYARKFRLKQLAMNSEKFKERRAADVEECRQRRKQKKADLKTVKPRKFFIGTEDCVRKFYELESVSRYLPGKKDYVTIKVNGKSKQIQKQVMMTTLLEAHQLFVKMFPDRQISYSKFKKLRPKNIVIMSKAPLNSCCCVYCENMKLNFDAVKPFLPECFRTVSMLLKEIVCNTENFSCMRGKCASCRDPADKLRRIVGSENLTRQAKIYHWEMNSVNILKK